MKKKPERKRNFDSAPHFPFRIGSVKQKFLGIDGTKREVGQTFLQGERHKVFIWNSEGGVDAKVGGGAMADTGIVVLAAQHHNEHICGCFGAPMAFLQKGGADALSLPPRQNREGCECQGGRFPLRSGEKDMADERSVFLCQQRERGEKGFTPPQAFNQILLVSIVVLGLCKGGFGQGVNSSAVLRLFFSYANHDVPFFRSNDVFCAKRGYTYGCKSSSRMARR